MQSLGLSTADRARFHSALHTSHSVGLEVAVLNMAGDDVARLQPVALSGQVNVAALAEVTRSATLSFLDPAHALEFDSDSPSDGALYFDRMIQARYSVLVPDVGRVVTPLVTGPLVKLDRSGDTVAVEVQGKELLARGGVPPLTVKKGANAVRAIETILEARCGETEFDFPSSRKRLPWDVSVGWDRPPWGVCQRIARALNMQLFYDGAGVCRLRRRSKASVFEFRGDSNVVSEVQVSHDRTQIRNRVRVVGNKPANAATVVAKRTHPLSPWRLGRNGVPFYMHEEINEPKVTSKKEARALAGDRLDDFLRMSLGVTFQAVPVPHLDPLDTVRIVTDDYAANFTLRDFSLPLDASGPMSVGYLQSVSKPTRRRVL